MLQGSANHWAEVFLTAGLGVDDSLKNCGGRWVHVDAVRQVLDHPEQAWTSSGLKAVALISTSPSLGLLDMNTWPLVF